MSAVGLHGASHLDGVRADLHRLLVALVKLALVDEAPETAGWSEDARAAQRRVAADGDAVATLPLDGLWTMAVRAAESDPVVRRRETVNPMLPTTAPLAAQSLIADPFSLDDAVQTIRDAASFG